MDKRLAPSAAQRRVAEHVVAGAELYRYEDPSHESWGLSNVPPINATVKVLTSVAIAMRRAGWIAPDGPPADLRSGRRQRWCFTQLGRSTLTNQAKGCGGDTE